LREVNAEFCFQRHLCNGRPMGYPLGVLFVHGIGSQKRGQTLRAFGGPLHAWLEEWLAGSCGPADHSSVTLTGTVLHSREAEPAHTVIHPERTLADGRRTESTWLLAESWWAEEFPTPSFQALAIWSLAVGPWIAQRYFNLRFIRGTSLRQGLEYEQRTLRTRVTTLVAAQTDTQVIARAVSFLLAYVFVPARRLLAALLALACGFLAQLAIALLLVIGVFPPLRRIVARAQRAMAESVGDSYALVSDPLAFDAMVTRVDTDLSWLSERCERVAVVAHSQGAVIARAVVERREQKDVSLFVTYGAGLVKLEVLRRLRAAPGRAATAFACRLAGGAAIVGAAVWGASPMALRIALAFLGLALVAFAARVGAMEQPSLAAGALDLPQLGAGLRWLDLYASSDPVPEGALRPLRLGLSSQQIKNRCSTFSDHTTYWRNAEDFVSRVCAELARVAGWREFDRLTRNDDAVLRDARTARDARTDWLVVARASTIVALVAAPIGFWHRGLQAVADAVNSAVDGVPGAERIARATDYLAANRFAAPAVGALVVVAALVFVYSLTVAPGWNLWDRRGRRLFAERRPRYMAPPWPLRIATVVVLIAWAPLAAWIDHGVSPAFWAATGVCGFLAVLELLPLGDDPTSTVAAGLLIFDRAQPQSRVELPVPRRALYTQSLGLAADDEAAWLCCGPEALVSWVSFGTGARYDIPVGAAPSAIALSATRAWVTTDDALIEIDAEAKDVLARHRVESGLVDLAVDAGTIWVAAEASSSVLRVNAATGDVAAVISVVERPVGIAVHDSGVWVVSRPSGFLTRIDSGTDTVVTDVDLRGVPFGRPVATSLALWVYDLQGELVRVDLASHDVTRHRISNGPMIGGIAAVGQEVWLVDGWKARIVQTRDGTETGTIGLPRRAQELAANDRVICVATYA
jgi:hypothetical protein